MADRIKFTDTQYVALLTLYEYAARDYAVSCTIKEIKKILGDSSSMNFLRSAMQENYQEKYVYFSKGAADDTDWRLTSSGIKYAEVVIESRKELYDFVVQQIDGVDAVPASDRVVKRDDNSEAYNEAGKLLEQVIQEFYDDHKIDNELGPEKNALLETLKAGSELWKSGSAKVDAINAFIINPLCMLRDRYEQAIAGTLITGIANEAITAFKALMSLITSVGA